MELSTQELETIFDVFATLTAENAFERKMQMSIMTKIAKELESAEEAKLKEKAKAAAKEAGNAAYRKVMNEGNKYSAYIKQPEAESDTTDKLRKAIREGDVDAFVNELLGL